MRTWLLGTIGIAAVVAGVLSIVFVFSMVEPPDATAYLLGGLWLTMPYLAALYLAVRMRRIPGALTILLIALLVTSAVGVWLYHASAAQYAISQQQVKTAVLPGEDPNSGPGGMRKSGAEMGAAVSGVFSILLAVIVPPSQLIGILLPTILSYLFFSNTQRKTRTRHIWSSAD
jgi:hypothetical protein